jgi:hypothetical protein
VIALDRHSRQVIVTVHQCRHGIDDLLFAKAAHFKDLQVQLLELCLVMSIRVLKRFHGTFLLSRSDR